MDNLDKKIKLKLTTLVEGRLNEQPLPIGDDIAALVTKYGQKFINLFGDDVVKAAEVNLGDDAVKLLARSVDDATLLTTVKNGTERAFITQSGKRDIPLSFIKRDLDLLNRDPSKYDKIVGRWKDLQLKNGTYVRDFFKRTPKPVPKPPTPKGEFRKGFSAPSPLKLALRVLKKPRVNLYNKETRMPKEDFIRLGGWLTAGVGDLNQVVEIFRRPGMGMIRKIYYSAVNLGGQYAGKVWYWTWRLFVYGVIRDLLLDVNSPVIVYDDFKEMLIGEDRSLKDVVTGAEGGKKGRLERALELAGYKFVSPLYNMYNIVEPILTYMGLGVGQSKLNEKRTIDKTHMIQKLDELMKMSYNSLLLVSKVNGDFEKWMKSLGNDKNLMNDPNKRRQYRRLKSGKLNPGDPGYENFKKFLDSDIDSTNYLDPEKIFGIKPQTNTSGANTQQPQNQQPQRTDNVVKPKFVDPF